MKCRNRNICMVLTIIMTAFSSNSYANTACENIQDYYGKTNVQVKELLQTKSAAEQRDDVGSANTCHDSFVAFNLKSGSPADQKPSQDSAIKIIAAAKDIEDEKKDDTDKLKDFNFAVGLGVQYISANPDIINTTVDNGVLRITNVEKYKLGLWLSSNTFFFSGKKHTYMPDGYKSGLFVATQLGGGGNNDILNSFALGFSFMTDRTKHEIDKAGIAPLVFQVGYGWTRIQTFADGYSSGMTLPNTVNQPVMKKVIGKGPVLLVSTAF